MKIKVCNKCGNQAYPSKNTISEIDGNDNGYEWQCFNCDEDLFEFEVSNDRVDFEHWADSLLSCIANHFYFTLGWNSEYDDDSVLFTEVKKYYDEGNTNYFENDIMDTLTNIDCIYNSELELIARIEILVEEMKKRGAK